MDDWFAPTTLQGHAVRLEPLTDAHVEDLFETSADPDVWRWLPAPCPSTADDMRAVIAAALQERAGRTRVPFATVDIRTGTAIGSTSYLDVVPAHRRIEIGWTWLGRPWWRTAANTEAKLLMLRHAFDELGARRVGLKTDIRNERSQAAIARLGAQREGVLRAHMVRPDGSSRDTVYFGIVSTEWPQVRALLEDRLRRGAEATA